MFEQPAAQQPSEQDKSDENAKQKEKRYRFYTPVDKDPNPVSRSKRTERIQRRQQEALNERPLKSQIYSQAYWSSIDNNIDSSAAAAHAQRVVEKEKEKSPETIKEIRDAKERIMRFTNSIGIDRSMKSFPDDEDIYVKKEITRESQAASKDTRVVGNCSSNEIEILETDARNPEQRSDVRGGMIPTTQHELIHGTCQVRNYVHEYGHEEIGIGFRSGDNGTFRSFNEGMTELTNVQIFFESDLMPDQIAYLDQSVLISMLVEDITDKINTTSLRVTTDVSDETTEYLREKMMLRDGIPKHDKSNPFFTQREILSYFQKGLFNSDRRCLKLLGQMYGQEALKALAHMGLETKDIIETARAFKSDNGIGDAIADRIQRYHNQESIIFGVAGTKISIRLKDRAS